MTSTLNVAVAGLGFMGATHLKAWKQVSSARLVAVMDMNESRLTGDLTSVGGNFGGSGEKLDFSAVRTYRTLAEALADPQIDAVDLCLPTYEHGTAAVAALRAGKHVLLEKPMGLSEAESSLILSEHSRSGRTLMVGQILRFSPAYSALADALASAGAVRSAVFRRRCAAPTWSGWLTDPARSGGGIFDLLIHDVDYCISLWGVPESVRAVGPEDLARGIDVVHAELQYANVCPVVVTGGWHHPGAFPFSMEFTVVTDQASFEWTNGAPDLHAYGPGQDTANRTLPLIDPFAAELAYFADCAVHGRQPERCLPQQSAQAVALMLRIIESRKRNGAILPCKP
ncbi:MAG TPA: Gfo/Idh/MocA family oxidoreductase [Candidatus Sulfotelmatobacter sp.]|nr:Gfo/Idh/MocA family oxidoreductase [Candidatus Sulfotelmatobacter sp.]